MAAPGSTDEVEEAMEAISRAYSLPVQYARKAVVRFNSREMESPLPRQTFSFQPGDYLHFKQPFGSSGWWVGRVIGEITWLGLLPSEEKLLAHRERVVRGGLEERREGEGDQGLLVYEEAPIMRPIVFLGPSSKNSEFAIHTFTCTTNEGTSKIWSTSQSRTLTAHLQKALVAFMKEQFSGRLQIYKPQLSIAAGLSDKQVWGLRGEIYRSGHTLNLVYLDCDASYHDEISWLHPLLIYVQVSRRRVLQKLVEEMTDTAEERTAQLQAAYRLYEQSILDHSPYSLVIRDSDLDDACQSLELFLESYWAATRSVSLTHTF